jgi:Domain of unknown function (DUF4158)
MRNEWSTEDLVATWTLVGEDWQLVGNKTGPTRLGFALLLKFFEIEGRFPRSADELPPAGVVYVAEQVQVDAAEVGLPVVSSEKTTFSGRCADALGQESVVSSARARSRSSSLGWV